MYSFKTQIAYSRLLVVESNVINILLSYFNEVLNLENIGLAVSFMAATAAGPIPSTLAHLVDWWNWSLCTLLPVLGVAISALKLLYVANFDALFAGDPLKLARAALAAATLLTFVPSLAAMAPTYSRASLTASVLVKGKPATQLNFQAWYLIGWTAACCLLLVVTNLGIPLYFRIKGNLATYNASYVPRISAKRWLLLLFGIAILINMNLLANSPDESGHNPFFGFIFLFATNTMLLFQLTEPEVWLFARRKLFNWLDPAVHPSMTNGNAIRMEALNPAGIYIGTVETK